MMNGEKGIPLYYQLKELIREKIESGEWKKGDQIPKELEMAEEYKISRITVRQAILDLVREGMLTRRPGIGTFVIGPKLEGDMINFHFPKDLGTKHVPISAKEIECPSSLINALNLNKGDTVFEVFRLRYFHEKPGSLEKSYLPSNLFPGLVKHDLPEGLWQDYLSETYGISIVKHKSTIEPVMMDEYESGILQAPKNQPALKLSRLGLTVQSKPVIQVKSIIRGDTCKFIFNSD